MKTAQMEALWSFQNELDTQIIRDLNLIGPIENPGYMYTNAIAIVTPEHTIKEQKPGERKLQL